MAEHFSLPPDELVTDDTSADWQVVMIFDNERAASIASGALESEGIATTLTNQTFSSVLPLGFNSVGGVRLWVPRDQADRALIILRRNGDLS